MASPAKVRAIAIRVARQKGIDPHVFARQINAESGFNDRAVSPAGARGAGQLMPGTARSLGVRNVNDAQQNLEGAATYLKQQLKAFGGDYRKALAAYNAGPGNIRAGLGYADKILAGHGTPSAPTPGAAGPTTKTIPGKDRSANRRQLIAQFLLGSMPSSSFADPIASITHDPIIALAQGLKGLKDTPSRTVTVAGSSGGGGATDTSAKGVATFEGKPVAAWIKPWLVKARQAGWKGSVTSGFRSNAEQARIYNSGVRPAAKPGQSNHNMTAFPGGAVDVSNAQQLSQILQRLGSPLKWAGSKDPVHFSHPHNGSY